MIVTNENYPLIFKAFNLIDLDNGKVNRLEELKEQYIVPEGWAAEIDDVERILSCLGDEEFEEMCIGDHYGLMEAHPHLELALADLFLGQFADEWPAEEEDAWEEVYA